MKIKIKLIDDDLAMIPGYKTKGSCGADLLFSAKSIDRLKNEIDPKIYKKLKRQDNPCFFAIPFLNNHNYLGKKQVVIEQPTTNPKRMRPYIKKVAMIGVLLCFSNLIICKA